MMTGFAPAASAVSVTPRPASAIPPSTVVAAAITCRHLVFTMIAILGQPPAAHERC
jgi:hypothetical protein